MVCRDDHFAHQAVGNGVALLKRQPVQVVPQQLAKGLGMGNDLLPMPRLLLRAG